MIGKKAGKACFKSIVLVPTKAEFDELGGYIPSTEMSRERIEEEILIPNFTEVKPIQAHKNSAISAPYIRMTGVNSLMGRSNYELDSVDLSFLENCYPGLSG